jgi:hypothetical protein
MLLDHGIAAVFNDNCLAMKTLDIWQRLGEDFSFVFCRRSG